VARLAFKTTEMPMRIVIVDGGGADQIRLSRIAERTRVCCELSALSLLAASPPEGTGVEAEHAAGAAPSVAVPARALLVEIPSDEPEIGVAMFEAIRADPQFDETLLLVAVTPERLWALGAYLGFDDFVVQPCQPAELAGRIAAAELRRQQRRLGEGVVPLDGMAVDRAAHQVLIDGRFVQLTIKEFALFSYFCENRGRVLSRQRLVAHVWGQKYTGGLRTVDVHVRRLRGKLGAALPLETLRSSGYRLRSCSDRAAGALPLLQPANERQMSRAALSTS
jgi:DNA-binding response OmpR family regulator